MPAPLDLTGHRYGLLTVVGMAGRAKFGRWQSAWRCLCDCGAELVVPIVRLRTATDSQRVDACPGCRAHPCVVCAIPILPPSLAAACSPACRSEHARRRWRAGWRRRVAADPDHDQKAHGRRLARAAMDPGLARRLADQARAARRRRKERIAADPSERAHARELGRQTYARHREEVQRRRRERLDRLSPEALARWMERMRNYSRTYAARRRAERASDPAAHRAYLDLMAEYRRRAGLLALAAVGAELLERL